MKFTFSFDCHSNDFSLMMGFVQNCRALSVHCCSHAFQHYSEAKTAADLAEEKFQKIWGGMKDLLLRRVDRSSSLPTSLFLQPEDSNGFELNNAFTGNRGSCSRRRCNTRKTKPKSKTQKTEPTKLRAIGLQPFKLRKNNGDPSKVKIFGFGGYTELPKNDLRLLYIKPVRRTPGWRTQKRRLLRERKDSKSNFSDDNRPRSPQGKMKTGNQSLPCIRLSKKMFHPGIETTNSSNTDIKSRSASLSICRNPTGRIPGGKRSINVPIEDKIEALLAKVVKTNKRVHVRGLQLPNSERTCLVRGACPAKCYDISLGPYCDPAEKWSTPRPATCTCFPRAHSVEVLERCYSLKSISSNICKILL